MKRALVFVGVVIALFGGSVSTQAPPPALAPQAPSMSVLIDAGNAEPASRGFVYSGQVVLRINGTGMEISAPTVVYRMRDQEIELPEGATIKLAERLMSFQYHRRR